MDPFGFRHELAWGQLARPSSFRPGRAISGFVTGRGGLGHAVLIVPDLERAQAFYTGVLGF
ncbi:MAG TPA: glyoxalase, partial [Deltaproteobacteria bacterium]|nr:glyoxalase [Deltaproteobacteria bacterium]